MKDDRTTNSHYITYTFHLKGWENVLFELGSERVNGESEGDDEDGNADVVATEEVR